MKQRSTATVKPGPILTQTSAPTCWLGVWAPGATYTDPMVHAEGAEALLAHITGIHQQMPGARIARTSEVQVHHDVARFAWQFTLPDGSSLPEGLDLAIFDSAGKIKRIVGFFGPLGSR